MGPDITNNESGKSPYALVIYCNNNLNIFNCCYHDADDMNKFYAFFIKSWQEHYEVLVTVVERKRGATATITKTVAWHVPVPVTRLRCRCKRKSGGSVSCKDGGVLPDTGSPRVSGKRGGPSKGQLGHGADNGCISYNTCKRSRTVVSGLYLRSVQTGRFSFGAK